MKIGFFAAGISSHIDFATEVKAYPELEFIRFDCASTIDNLHLLGDNGCEGFIYYSGTMENEEYYKEIAKQGVKYVCTCSVGYDHYNLPAMKKYGLVGANIPGYSPNAISEHAVMLTLAILRNFRYLGHWMDNYDYTLHPVIAKEMRNQTIGVIGAGRIGCEAIKALHGFGPKKIYAFSLEEREDMRALCEYTDIETIYRECDVILFHCLATKENYHMVNRESISRMKDGVILVNCARGSLFDMDDVADALESGKIGGLGLDVVEHEGLLRGKLDHCPIPAIERMMKHDNFIFTNHSAFITDEALRNMATLTFDNFMEYIEKGYCHNELVK